MGARMHGRGRGRRRRRGRVRVRVRMRMRVRGCERGCEHEAPADTENMYIPIGLS